MVPVGETVKRSGAWEARLEASKAQVRLARAALGVLARLSPDLAARAAVRLFRTVRRHRVPKRELAWIEAADPVRHRGDGVRLEGLAWGSGPTVLLMHGWEGRASQMGAVGLALAESGFRAVAIEAPGHGDERPRISSLWQFADAVSGFAERVGPLAGFVGHSFGNAGACYAHLRGTLPLSSDVERLVFVSPPGDLNDFFEVLFSLLGLGPEVRRGFVHVMESGLELPWDTTRRCTQLAAADVPLLVVHDEDDLDTPMSGAESVVAAWPGSRLLRTTGLGHRRVLRDPATLEEITGFLSGARAAVGAQAGPESGRFSEESGRFSESGT